MKKFTTLLSLLLIMVLIAILGACSPAEEATEEVAEPTEAMAEPTEAMAEPTEAMPEPTEEEMMLPDLGGRKITVAIENAYIPFNFILLDTGEPGGWDYDFLAEACARLNCVPEYVEFGWDTMIISVSQGQFDMAADGITIKPERAEIVDFSDGYISVEQRMLVRLDEERFSTAEEFAANPDLIFAEQVGTTNYDVAAGLVGEERVLAFDTFGLAVQAVLSGDADAVVIDDTAGLGYQGENKEELKLLSESLSSDQLGFIFPKGSDLVEPFNMVIAQMKADGSLSEINGKWFDPSLTLSYDDIDCGAYCVDVGTTDNPIKVLFVPSVDAQVITSGGEIMANALKEATGLEFEVSVPTSYAATIEEMCASPDNTMGFIPGLGYVLANQLCGVDVAFKAVRFGYSVYWAQILVPRDSDIQSVEDLDGLKWAYPDAGSTSGYMVPLVMFQDAGITPGETLEAGGHTGSVRALYNGEADFSTSFYSPYLSPEGMDSWKPGDPPELPDEVIQDCAPNDDGSRLMCDGYRVLDARAGLRTEAPDVVQKLRILTISPDIPNDTLSFGPDFPADLREQIVDALIAFSQTDTWNESIGSQDFYGWTGIEPAFDEEYDFVRQMVEAVGLTLENLGE